MTLLAFAALVLSAGLVARGIALLFPRRRTRPAVPGGKRRDFFGDRLEGSMPAPVREPRRPRAARPAPAAAPSLAPGEVRPAAASRLPHAA